MQIGREGESETPHKKETISDVIIEMCYKLQLFYSTPLNACIQVWPIHHGFQYNAQSITNRVGQWTKQGYIHGSGRPGQGPNDGGIHRWLCNTQLCLHKGKMKDLQVILRKTLKKREITE